VSGSFGGGVLSRVEKQAVALSGERSKRLYAIEGNHCEAADPVLKGLGGASQEDQQPALVFREHKKALDLGPALFLYSLLLISAPK